MELANINIIKILVLLIFSSATGVIWAPFLIKFLYKYKLWRKSVRQKSIDGKELKIFKQFHSHKEIGTPRMGGIIIWITTIFTALFFALLYRVVDIPFLQKLDFLSRNQTWVPLAVLAAGSLLGLADDILQIFGKGKYTAGGITFTRRLLIITLIGIIAGAWFFFKLDKSSIHIPGDGDWFIGFWYIPLFIFTMLGTWAGGSIDGLDGLAGGAMSIIFGAFTVIAFSNGQYDLAALSAVLMGTTLSFLWFNTPPAKFYMGETGMIGLTSVLATIAFLTDSIVVLPIIAGLLVIEAGSVIIQLTSKRFFKRKVFLAAPIHHHFQAKGWSSEKITMRFWIVGILFAIIGVTIRLLG